MKNRTFLTERDRYYIETSLKEKVTVKDIAKVLHKSPSCIYREIKRGTINLLNSDLSTKSEYCADYSQARYDELKKNHGPSLKIGNDLRLCEFIEDKIINDKLSPYAVSVLIKHNNFSCTLSTQTIYRYIDEGIFLKLTNDYLPVKKQGKKHYRKVTVALKNLKGESIENRPENIKNRKEFGHWELDSVIGKQGITKSVFTVFTERLTRYEIVLKSMDKSCASVIRQFDLIEHILGTDKFKSIFKTITVDNGSEFLDYQNMEKSISSGERTKIYYCHPYRSCERASNENQNKLVRRWYPKGTNLDDVTNEDLKRLNSWINNLPRKLFKGKSSQDIISQFIDPDLFNFPSWDGT